MRQITPQNAAARSILTDTSNPKVHLDQGSVTKTALPRPPPKKLYSDVVRNAVLPILPPKISDTSKPKAEMKKGSDVKVDPEVVNNPAEATPEGANATPVVALAVVAAMAAAGGAYAYWQSYWKNAESLSDEELDGRDAVVEIAWPKAKVWEE
eukprot:Selendium_serpulae@DN5797_c0_g1_i11.p1